MLVAPYVMRDLATIPCIWHTRNSWREVSGEISQKIFLSCNRISTSEIDGQRVEKGSFNYNLARLVVKRCALRCRRSFHTAVTSFYEILLQLHQGQNYFISTVSSISHVCSYDMIRSCFLTWSGLPQLIAKSAQKVILWVHFG